MFFFHLVALFTVFGTALASPAPGVAGATQYYRLMTKVIAGDPTKDGLFVQSYHTNAGLNDATLTSNEPRGSRGFINGTYQQFELGTTFPSGMILAYNQYYTRWLDIHIDAGYGDTGFSFNGSGLISSNPEWHGWLACDWYHVVPQLFWQYYFEDFALPSSCAKVQLLPKPII